MEEIRKIEGSAYGCPIFGFNDGIIYFLQRLSWRYHKDNKVLGDLYRLFEEASIDECILAVLTTLSPKSDLSPKGFVSYLILVHDIIYSDFKSFAQKIFTEKYLKILCQLLK
jgi:fused-like protein